MFLYKNAQVLIGPRRGANYFAGMEHGIVWNVWQPYGDRQDTWYGDDQQQYQITFAVQQPQIDSWQESPVG